MSYLVLARKYRPKRFGEVAGQDVQMRVLQGAIQEGRVGHAYLFTGPRGTGKTTAARIFAKALNCERGPAPDPCGECERCLCADAGSEVDLIEIDAASNRGIDEARRLREEVSYAPMRARYKVYIVDEVHMLTGPAFNALLKTLEEPPPHAKFLFATTEPHKVIETVRSRCQIVRLALIGEDVIAARLDEILEQEKVEADAGVARELARLARGSMRDALSLADQLLALSGTRPTVEDVRRIAGSGGAERIEELCARLEAGDRAGALAALPPVQGGEGELVAALLDHLRGALLASLAPGESQLFEVDPAQRERLRARGQRLGPERLQAWLEELIAARERMGALPQHARLALELALIELCRGDVGLPIAALTKRLEALEERLQRGGSGEAPRAAPSTERPAAPPRPSAPRPAPSNPSGPAPGRRGDSERAELAQRDAFTRSVAELFTGQIEDTQIGEAP